ncbi:hypothetical protein KCU67_g3, partial [Aureobasidium melanogenum]
MAEKGFIISCGLRVLLTSPGGHITPNTIADCMMHVCMRGRLAHAKHVTTTIPSGLCIQAMFSQVLMWTGCVDQNFGLRPSLSAFLSGDIVDLIGEMTIAGHTPSQIYS